MKHTVTCCFGAFSIIGDTLKSGCVCESRPFSKVQMAPFCENLPFPPSNHREMRLQGDGQHKISVIWYKAAVKVAAELSLRVQHPRDNFCVLECVH